MHISFLFHDDLYYYECHLYHLMMKSIVLMFCENFHRESAAVYDFSPKTEDNDENFNLLI